MKRILIITVILLLFSVGLIGCSKTTKLNVNMEGEITNTQLSEFVNICNEPISLSYDTMTRIVYMKSKAYGRNVFTYTPYYAPNGLPYRYNPETNTFEEIDK